MDAVYTLTVNRKDTEFEVVKFDQPDDAFGKRMLAIILLRLVEHLDPELTGKETQ